MTSTLTLVCPEGIILAADMRITRVDPQTEQILDYKDGVEKIYHVKKTETAISFWGLAEFQGKKILQHLESFEKTRLYEKDSVDKIAEKLKEYLKSITPPMNSLMGLHVAGYINEDGVLVPRLRHVFHWKWHKPGEFTDENCHEEYHFSNGDRVLFRKRRKYPVLFNGDNLVANALFNYAPKVRPYYRILTDKLHREDCIELANLIINTSIQRLGYFFDVRHFEKVEPTVGGGVLVAEITPTKGFQWVNQ